MQIMKKKMPANNIDTQLIKSHVTGKSREFLIAHPEFQMTLLQKFRYTYLIKKRNAGIPLAYLIGRKEFFGLDFIVNKHTLVPRPDTELMVEKTLDHLTTLPPDHKTILIDIGTGSGCIPISILKNTKQHIKTFATDISRGALRIAKQNAKKHDVNITFLHGNLLEPRIYELGTQNTELLITANLPYLDESWYEESPSIRHEPKSALVADKKGTALYRELIEQIENAKLSATILMEIDPRQVNDMKQLLDGRSYEIKKDLCGKDRLIILSI